MKLTKSGFSIYGVLNKRVYILRQSFIVFLCHAMRWCCDGPTFTVISSGSELKSVRTETLERAGWVDTLTVVTNLWRGTLVHVYTDHTHTHTHTHTMSCQSIVSSHSLTQCMTFLASHACLPACLTPEADLGMFSMFGRTGAPQKGAPTRGPAKFCNITTCQK